MSDTAQSAGLRPGTLLNDRFEVGEPIGAGAMGSVYRGVDRNVGEGVAIKVLHPRLVSSREYVSRFKREALAASRFRHESAVKVLGTGDTDQGLPFIAMELVEGRSLKEILEGEGSLPIGRACNIAEQLLGALGAAHQRGIVHRDIKPENVRVVVDEDGIERPKILDFGIVKFISSDLEDLEGAVKTKTGVVLGTPKYMAPEQVRGEAVDGRADIYAVGAMTYEMLAGEPPFVADDLFGFVAMHLKQAVTPLAHKVPEKDVPVELDEVVLHMLEKDPADRPSDAAALAERLKRWSVEDPRAGEKHRALNVATGIVAAAGVAAAAIAHFVVPELDVATGAAGVGLGVGAAVAARLLPRPSVGGYVRRVLVVAAAIAAVAGISLVVPASQGAYATASMSLAALLVYVAYLTVWSNSARWPRLVVAGVVAPLIAACLIPMRVVGDPGQATYFIRLFGSAANAMESDARQCTILALAIVALTFAAASLTLPKAGAARV